MRSQKNKTEFLQMKVLIYGKNILTKTVQKNLWLMFGLLFVAA